MYGDGVNRLISMLVIVLGYDDDQVPYLMEAVPATEADQGHRWRCKVCRKVSNTRQIIARHVESHLDSPGLNCSVCGTFAKNRNALRKHFYMRHKTQ